MWVIERELPGFFHFPTLVGSGRSRHCESDDLSGKLEAGGSMPQSVRFLLPILSLMFSFVTVTASAAWEQNVTRKNVGKEVCAFQRYITNGTKRVFPAFPQEPSVKQIDDADVSLKSLLKNRDRLRACGGAQGNQAHCQSELVEICKDLIAKNQFTDVQAKAFCTQIEAAAKPEALGRGKSLIQTEMATQIAEASRILGSNLKERPMVVGNRGSLLILQCESKEDCSIEQTLLSGKTLQLDGVDEEKGEILFKTISGKKLKLNCADGSMSQATLEACLADLAGGGAGKKAVICRQKLTVQPGKVIKAGTVGAPGQK